MKLKLIKILKQQYDIVHYDKWNMRNEKSSIFKLFDQIIIIILLSKKPFYLEK